MLTENNGKTISQIFTVKIKEESINENLENININGSNNVLNKPFIMAELKKTLKHLKINKTTGYDNISKEFLKLSTERIMKLIIF